MFLYYYSKKMSGAIVSGNGMLYIPMGSNSDHGSMVDRLLLNSCSLFGYTSFTSILLVMVRSILHHLAYVYLDFLQSLITKLKRALTHGKFTRFGKFGRAGSWVYG